MSRITYQSPEGRVRVEMDGPSDYSLYLDGQYTGSYKSGAEAEVAGGAWLHEQSEQLVIDLADEQAARDELVNPIAAAVFVACSVALGSPTMPRTEAEARALGLAAYDPEQPDPTPPAAGPRVIWRFGGTTRALASLIAERRRGKVA